MSASVTLYYAVLVTAPNDRSRPIDCYLGIVQVIMSLVGLRDL